MIHDQRLRLPTTNAVALELLSCAFYGVSWGV